MLFFFFKQETANCIRLSLVGSEMCIRNRFIHIHDVYAECNPAYRSCIISPREMHSEAVSGHF